MSFVHTLANEMLSQKQVSTLPAAAHAAFTPVDDDRWQAVQKAWDAIGPMFWGPRIALDDACAEVRSWLDAEIGT